MKVTGLKNLPQSPPDRPTFGDLALGQGFTVDDSEGYLNIKTSERNSLFYVPDDDGGGYWDEDWFSVNTCVNPVKVELKVLKG